MGRCSVAACWAILQSTYVAVKFLIHFNRPQLATGGGNEAHMWYFAKSPSLGVCRAGQRRGVQSVVSKDVFVKALRPALSIAIPGTR